MLSVNTLKRFIVGLCLVFPTWASATSEYIVDENVAYGPYYAQRFDVYAPPDARNAPIIVMVHGGMWAGGDKRDADVITNKINHWVIDKGIIFISVNYRVLPSFDPLSQAEDVGRAIAKIQKKAHRWGGDPTKVLLMGHSSGAHLVSVLGSSPTFVKDSGADYPIIGVVSLANPVFNLLSTMESANTLYDSIFEDPSEWIELSPSHLVEQTAPPFLLVCSRLYFPSCQQEVEFQGISDDLDVMASTLKVNLNHSAINGSLGKDNNYTQQVTDFIDDSIDSSIENSSDCRLRFRC